MSISITRYDLQQISNIPDKVVRWLESLAGIGQANSDAIKGITDATQGIQDATALTLSSNAALNNERVFMPDPDHFLAQDGGPNGAYTLSLLYPITINGGFACTFNLEADTNLDFPSSGRVMTTDYRFPGPYANDGAAATAGIAVGATYRRTDGVMAWRVS